MAFMQFELEDTIEDKTLRPPETTAAEVSSHEVSMPRTITALAPGWNGRGAITSLAWLAGSETG